MVVVVVQSLSCAWIPHPTEEEWRNSSRKNKEDRPKRKHGSAVDASGGESKVQCCKEQYCIGTWNIRSITQGKLDVVKQEMTTENSDILGISDLKWMGMGKFNSDDHFIYYSGQEFLGGNGVALIINRGVWNAILGCSLKNDRMILVHFWGKLFNILVIQVYAPTTNAEEAEVGWFMMTYKTFKN